MYPTRELRALARHKQNLLRRSAAERRRCGADAAVVAAPLRQIDLALAQWRRLSPWLKAAAVPLGWWLVRPAARKVGRARGLLRWTPLLFGFGRALFAARSARRAPA